MAVTTPTAPTQPWASTTDTSSPGFNPKRWTKDELGKRGRLFDTGAFEKGTAVAQRAAGRMVAGVQQAQLRANALLPGGGARDLQTRELAEASAEAGAAGAGQAYEVAKVAEEKDIAIAAAEQAAEDERKRQRRQTILKVGATIGTLAVSALNPVLGAALGAALSAATSKKGGGISVDQAQDVADWNTTRTAQSDALFTADPWGIADTGLATGSVTY